MQRSLSASARVSCRSRVLPVPGEEHRGDAQRRVRLGEVGIDLEGLRRPRDRANGIDVGRRPCSRSTPRRRTHRPGRRRRARTSGSRSIDRRNASIGEPHALARPLVPVVDGPAGTPGRPPCARFACVVREAVRLLELRPRSGRTDASQMSSAINGATTSRSCAGRTNRPPQICDLVRRVDQVDLHVQSARHESRCGPRPARRR